MPIHTTGKSRIDFLCSPLFILSTAILITMVAVLAWIKNKNATSETGLLEITQAIFLGLACAIAAYRALQKKLAFLERYLCLGLMIFCFALLLREIDIDKLGTSARWAQLEKFLRGITLISLLIYIAFMLKNIRFIWRHAPTIMTSPMVHLGLFACVAYLSSWPFDKMLFDLPDDYALLIEETLELNACLLLLFASVMTVLKTSKLYSANEPMHDLGSNTLF